MTLNDFDLPGILVRVGAALIILIATALIAKLIKNVLSKQLTKIPALQRQDGGGHTLGESLATIASLVVWLFGLIAVLNLFKLTQVVAPIQELLNGVLAVLPGIIGAALIFFVGLVIARIVRQLVETGLQAAGADRWLNRVTGDTTTHRAEGAAGGSAAATPGSPSTSSASSTPPLSRIAGQLVFALILIVISISALQVLGIDAIADPATQMLQLILNAIPAIIAAVLLLGIGYAISSFVAPILESTLAGLGVDRALSDLTSGGGAQTSARPSTVISKIAQIAIVLFFAIAATRVLGFPEITNILDTVLEVAGGIVLGGAVIAIGVLIANLAPRFISGQAGQVVRWAAIALFVAIGLRSMGLADSIVNLAFGAIVVGLAAAGALAFGLGGRDAAARQLQQLQDRTATQNSPLGANSGSGATRADRDDDPTI